MGLLIPCYYGKMSRDSSAYGKMSEIVVLLSEVQSGKSLPGADSDILSG